MEDQAKCVMPDYKVEFDMLCDEHKKLSAEFSDMKRYFEKQAIENEIMKAQLEMVYLIFGGRNYG